MPASIIGNEMLLRCACGDHNTHIAWLIYEPVSSRENNLKGVDDDWYLMVSLDPNFGFWRRLREAIRYLINPQNMRYCGYSDIVLQNKDVDALVTFISERRYPE